MASPAVLGVTSGVATNIRVSKNADWMHDDMDVHRVRLSQSAISFLRNPHWGWGVSVTWTSAATIPVLGELTAEWLDGRLPSHPLYHGRPDPETVELIPVLSALNRRGLVTTGSQPGLRHEQTEQRAFLDGFASPELAEELFRVCFEARLRVLVAHPGENDDARFVVTRESEKAVTWSGCLPSEELALFRPYVSEAAMTELAGACRFVVVDRVWGPSATLWESLQEWLDATRTVAPG